MKHEAKITPIEGLRGVAILLVVIFHLESSFLPSGFVGVDIFLTISGYVVVRSVVRRARKDGGFQLFEFFVRRLRRLLPTLFAGIILTLPLLKLVQSPLGAFQNSLWTGLGSLAGVSNGVIQYLSGGYFGDDAQLNGYLHTWSLSVEIQFYLALGFLLAAQMLVSRSLWNTNQSLKGLLWSLTVLSLGLLFASSLVSLPYEELGLFGYYSPLVRIWQFAIGGLVALSGSVKISMAASRLLATMSLFGILILSFSYGDFGTGLGTFFQSSLASLFTAALIRYLRFSKSATSLLSIRPLVHLGGVSYALYVFHWPFLVVAKTLSQPLWMHIGFLFFSYLLALLISRGVEYPILRRNMAEYKGQKAFALLSITAVFSAVFVLAIQFSQTESNRLKELRSAIQERHLPARHDWLCATGPLENSNQERCLFNQVGNESPPIYLIGDSQAGMHSESILAIAESKGASLTISTTTACPFFLSSSTSDRCDNFVLGSLSFLADAQPGLVFITFSKDFDYSVEADIGFLYALDQIKAAGHQLYLIEAIPHLVDYAPLACSASDVENLGCFISRPLYSFREDLNSIDSLFSRAVKNNLADFIEIRSAICPEGVCQTLLSDTVIYRDSSHLSVQSSEILSPHISKQLN